MGITSLRMVSRSSDINVEGIGFAIPSTTVKTIADQLIAAGEVTGRPGIGITVTTILTWAAAEYSYPDGLYVYAVSTGSDAEAKGVQPGDILTHVNGQAVAKTDDVLSQRDLLNVGDTLTLTLYRDGEIFDVDITLQDIDDLY
ncbi:MAG: S1C family serine protease [Oscillospiraceae bacterium]|nr:S1C family serine protease [Oscillospiraceae bacterium]